MITPQKQAPPGSRDDLIHSLAGTNAAAEIHLAHRTRRVIHGAILNLRRHKSRSKRSFALTLASIFAILIVLCPMIWNAVDHLIGEEHFGDIQTQMALLLLFALSALLAALLLIGQPLEEERRSRRQL